MGPFRRNPAEVPHEEQTHHVVFKADRLNEREKIQCYGSEFTPVDEWANKYVSSHQALEQGILFHIPLDLRHFSRRDSVATDEAYGKPSERCQRSLP